MVIQRKPFGEISVGDYSKIIYEYTIKKEKATVKILTYGATISSVLVPDKDGVVKDVVLGFSNQEGYFGDNNPYFGSTVGRVANRIENAKIKVKGRTYNISANVPPNTLHGGFHGFDKKIWDATTEDNALVMTCLSEHLEEGFPGYVETRVIYELTDDSELRITYKAKTTLPTPINLTNHAYFNLAGHDAGSKGVYEHEIFIDADSYTPTNAKLIPTGDLASVFGTPLDFTKKQNLGSAIVKSPNGSGFDNNYCINGTGFRLAARAHHKKSGRVLEVFTDQPGLQFYTGNFLENITGKDGFVYNKHSGFCFESQNYPNAVNISCFPNSVIEPDGEYVHNLIFKFSTES